MDWRRGILLAGINLSVAVPLMVMLEARDEVLMHDRYGPSGGIASNPVRRATPSGEDEQVFPGNPCSMTIDFPKEQQVAEFANLPAGAISGWRLACHAHWSLAGRLNVDYFWVQPPSTIPARRAVDWGFAILILIQWFLVGGFPLVQPQRWRLEPGAFITCCAAIGFGLVLIRPIQGIAQLPALLAAFAWLWWFGLLVWKCARFCWRLVARLRVATS